MKHSAGQSNSPKSFELVIPADVEPRQVVSWLRGITSEGTGTLQAAFAPRVLAYEIVGMDNSIRHILTVPPSREHELLAQTRAAFPGLRLKEAADAVPACDFVGEWQVRILADQTLVEPASASASLLGAFTVVRGDEALMLQFVIARGRTWRQDPLAIIGGKRQVRRAEPAHVRVAVRIGSQTPDRARAAQLARGLVSSLRGVLGHGAVVRRRRLPKQWARLAFAERSIPVAGSCSWFPVEMLAAVSAIPVGYGHLIPGVAVSRSILLPPGPTIQSKGLVLGRAAYPGRDINVAVPWHLVTQHLYCAAPTRAGKSVFAEHLGRQVIENNWGLVVFDLDGDLAQRLAGQVPSRRRRDVIYWSLSDTARPFGFNLLKSPYPAKAAESILNAIRQIWPAHLGARTEALAVNTALLLASDPEASFASALTVLQSRSYRRRLLKKTTDSWVNEFFEWWDGQLTEAARTEMMQPLAHRLRAFMRPELRNVFGQAESSFSMEEALHDGKILLIDLGRGSLGHLSGLVAQLLLDRLWAAALTRRADDPRIRPTFLLLDEFQTVARLSSGLEEILSEARKRKLAACMLHQGTEQLPRSLLSAALTNAATKIVLRTGAADAAIFSREIGVKAEAIGALPNHEAYAVVATDQGAPTPVSITMQPPLKPISDARSIIEESRQKFGRPRGEVEAAIDQRGRKMEGRPDDLGPIGERTVS